MTWNTAYVNCMKCYLSHQEYQGIESERQRKGKESEEFGLPAELKEAYRFRNKATKALKEMNTEDLETLLKSCKGCHFSAPVINTILGEWNGTIGKRE